VLSEPAGKASALLSWPAAQIENVLKKLEAVARRRAVALGNERLMVIYAPGKNVGKDWDDSLIAGFIRKNTKVVTVGDDGTVIRAVSGQISVVTAAKASESGPTLTMLCAAGQLCVFAAGKPIAEIGASPPPVQGRSDWQRSSWELKGALDTHFLHCIENQKGLRYWANKDKRTLLAGPDGTEKLFHHSLFWWLSNFITDALDVYGETQGMGQDKTDITIVTEAGSIVTEVKWLGKNENGTSYAEVRINEGMIQVADYLTRNQRLIQGYLVLYDARCEQDYKEKSSYPASCRHQKCEEPILYFLRSETPSDRGARLAAEMQV
jgi:hypothetical protein